MTRHSTLPENSGARAAQVPDAPPGRTLNSVVVHCLLGFPGNLVRRIAISEPPYDACQFNWSSIFDPQKYCEDRLLIYGFFLLVYTLAWYEEKSS